MKLYLVGAARHRWAQVQELMHHSHGSDAHCIYCFSCLIWTFLHIQLKLEAKFELKLKAIQHTTCWQLEIDHDLLPQSNCISGQATKATSSLAANQKSATIYSRLQYIVNRKRESQNRMQFHNKHAIQVYTHVPIRIRMFCQKITFLITGLIWSTAGSSLGDHAQHSRPDNLRD